MLMIVVKDRESYLRLDRKDLKALLTCTCDNSDLIFWGTYTRQLISGDHFLIIVQRVRCKGCQKTHAVLPSFVLGRVRHSAATIQAYFQKWIESRYSLVRSWSESTGPENMSTVYCWRRRFRQALRGFVAGLTSQAFVPQSGH